MGENEPRESLDYGSQPTASTVPRQARKSLPQQNVVSSAEAGSAAAAAATVATVTAAATEPRHALDHRAQPFASTVPRQAPQSLLQQNLVSSAAAGFAATADTV